MIKLSEQSFVGRVMMLAAGAVVGQGIGVITMPLVSRLFSVADFGAWAIVWAYCAFLASSACLGYDVAIPNS